MNDKRTQVAVIGGATIDIFGKALKKIIPEDSNVGLVDYSYGGVARNIANNLSKLGVDVELLCVLGQDENAQRLISHCRSEGIGLNHCLRSERATATYLSINQPSGDIYVAIADMGINDELSQKYINEKLAFLNSCEIVVCDTNLSVETLAYLMANVTAKIIIDPVSGTKAEKLHGNLHNIRAIKPNYLEAVAITGLELSEADLLTELLRGDITEVYLTLGARGLICGDKNQQLQFENYPGNIVNTTGCGDAFLAGVVYGELKGADLATKSRFGLAAASICCRSANAINSYLSEEELLKTVR